MLAVGILTALTVAATVVASFLIAERADGFIFWMRTGFLCFIELLVGALIIGNALSLPRGFRPSNATMILVYGVVALYALGGIIAILIYQPVRNPEAPQDLPFAGFFLAGTTIAFVMAAFLWAYDVYFRHSYEEVEETRADHRRHSQNLRRYILVLQSLSPADPGNAQELHQCIRLLERLELNLNHSHGGRTGISEYATEMSSNRANELDIALAIEEIGDSVERLRDANDADAARERIGSIRPMILRLAERIDAFELA